MNAWLDSLSRRDKTALSICGLFCSLVFLFFFVISPLLNHFDHLKSEVKYQQELLGWMKGASQQLQTAKPSRPEQNLPLLEAISKSIIDEKLNDFQHEIAQELNENKARVQFKLIPFPYLVSWLTLLKERYQVSLNSIDLTPKKPGIVQATILLEK